MKILAYLKYSTSISVRVLVYSTIALKVTKKTELLRAQGLIPI